jgi:hypothetical protein
MNLDLLASVTLAAQALLLPAILVISSRLEGMRRAVVLAIAGGWLLLLGGLSAAGFFSASAHGTPFVGVAVLVPVMAVLFLRNRSSTLRALIATVPLTLLVAVHVGRLLGVEFLLMHAAGRLPATFAYEAGWGDIIVAAASLPVAFAAHRRIRGWRSLVLPWNWVGVADLMVAVALGAGSAAGSPIRFLYEEPSSALMGTLPWFLIPGYLVPLYLVTHVAIFFRLTTVSQSTLPNNVDVGSPSTVGQ